MILCPVPGSRDSATVTQAVIAAVGALPAQIRRSLTWDCGSELALHADVTATGLPVYFARPHSPWERGSNENMNRVIREFLPQGTKITTDPKHLAAATTDPVRSMSGRSPPRYSLNSLRMLRPPEFAPATLDADHGPTGGGPARHQAQVALGQLGTLGGQIFDRNPGVVVTHFPPLSVL